MIVVGIDPDARGGLAIRSPIGTTYRHLPLARPVECCGEIIAAVAGAAAVYIETIPPIPGKGRIGAATQSQRWGMLREQIRAASAGRAVRVVEVNPTTWQAALRLSAGKGEGRKLHKARMWAVAQKLCPGVPLGGADAVLIAAYGAAAEAGR